MSNQEVAGLLQEIIDRLDRLEAAVNRQADPATHVSAREYSVAIGAAMRSGDRREVRRLYSLMNGSRT